MGRCGSGLPHLDEEVREPLVEVTYSKLNSAGEDALAEVDAVLQDDRVSHHDLDVVDDREALLSARVR